MPAKYLEGREEDHIVAQKTIPINTDEAHTVTLKHYPVKYYDGDTDKVIPEREEQWWVEVDVGGCFNEVYRLEESARYSYDLINEDFIMHVSLWHKLRSDTETYRRHFIELHSRRIFEGRPND